jgi:hypothetical protein
MKLEWAKAMSGAGVTLTSEGKKGSEISTESEGQFMAGCIAFAIKAGASDRTAAERICSKMWERVPKG